MSNFFDLGNFWESILGWFIKKLLSALTAVGAFGVSYEGIDLLTQQIIHSVQYVYNSIPVEIMQILSLAGFGFCLNVILSAVISALTLKATKSIFKGFTT